MNKFLVFGLLVMLVVVAGCAKNVADQAADKTVPTTSVGSGTAGDAALLDATGAESLDTDLSSDDVDKQLAGINLEEVKDINF